MPTAIGTATALGIARVSTTTQAGDDRYSLTYQEDSIARYAREHGLVLQDVVQVVTSGASVRGVLRDLARRVQAEGIAVVLVFEWDRLARDLLALLEFLETVQAAGAEVISVTQGPIRSPEDQLAATIHGTFAQYFRAQLARKTRAGRRKRAESGRPMGRVPYGYQRQADGVWVPDPATAPVVRAIFTWYAAGWGRRRIAAALNRQGHRTSTGRVWTLKTVGDVLGRPAYVGDLVHGRTRQWRDAEGHTHRARTEPLVIPDAVPALIPRALWDEVQARRRLQHAPDGHAAGAARYLYSGLLRCGVCGSNMLKVGERYLCAAYHQRGACTFRTSWRIGPLEDAVLADLADRLAAVQAGHVDAATQAAWCGDRPDWEVYTQRQDQARATLAALPEQEARATADYVAGRLDAAGFAAVRAHLTATRQSAEADLAAPPPVIPATCVQDRMRAAYDLLQEARHFPGYQTRYRVPVRGFIRRIVCHPDHLQVEWGPRR